MGNLGLFRMWKDLYHAGIEGCERGGEGVLCDHHCTYDMYI